MARPVPTVALIGAALCAPCGRAGSHAAVAHERPPHAPRGPNDLPRMLDLPQRYR